MSTDGQSTMARRRKRQHGEPPSLPLEGAAADGQLPVVSGPLSVAGDRQPAGNDQRSPISDQQSAASGQQSAISDPPAAGSDRPLDDDTAHSARGPSDSALRTPHSAFDTPHSALGTPHSPEPPPALAEVFGKEGALIQRRRYGRAAVLILLAIFRLVATTLLVLGLVGAAAYMTLRFYVGGREIKVPNVCGSSVEDALEKLDSAGLLLKFDRREYSEVVPRGNIVAQFPAPDTKVKTGTPVRLVLSDGAVRVRAPNLVGMTEINAGVAVRSVAQADLDLGPGAADFSPKVKKGDVIAQDPPPGTPILRGSKVRLLVSRGPKPADYNMPDLRNRTIQEARTTLAALQLLLGEIREADQAGADRGIVLAQQPGPGTRVMPGGSVILTIATGLGEPSTARPAR
jgi:serine/threonine-protein kinase